MTMPRAPRLTTAPRKLVAIFGAGEGVEGAVGGDEFDGGDGGGEVVVVAAGAVGGGGAGSDDGDVGERGEVVDGEAAGVDEGGELAVADAGSDGDGAGFGVEEIGSSCLREIWAWVLSAMALKEWPRPRARSLGEDLTICWTSSTVAGWWRWSV